MAGVGSCWWVAFPPGSLALAGLATVGAVSLVLAGLVATIDWSRDQ